LLLLALFTRPAPANAQTQPASAAPLQPGFEEVVEVIGTTPLPGIGLPADRVPAPVQVANAIDLEGGRALDVSDALNRRLTSVHVNTIQGNPFQADVNYRGYTASPLLGTPQGLSIYMDGVRINQPFGDVVSWDLIPRAAIASATLIPGSNPIFGLNTLGGALSMRTKDGQTNPGTVVQASLGSYLRRAIELEHGASRPNGLHWFVTGHLFGEDGWREQSPSDIRQVFGKLGRFRPTGEFSLTAAWANNSLNGNGLQERRLLDRDYSSIYTKPDITENQSTFLNLSARRTTSRGLTFSGNVYYRHVGTSTLNADINERSLDQSVYQPGAAERAALAEAGYPNVPASGLSAANTPFPFLRCLGNILIRDEPGEKCNGLVNRGRTRQHNEGLSGQATHRDGRNQLTVGAAFDHSRLALVQSLELGYLNADRSVTGTGVFADGVNAGEVDGEPFDARVDLTGRVRTISLFLTDTLTVARVWHITASGRFNQTTVRNRDAIEPGGGPGSLDGDHTFSRFNPAVGATYNRSTAWNAYAGYTEGSRAATSIELGCADPATPCKLPNAMAGDPPLNQVVTKTVEAGVRGRVGGRATWSVGAFHARNRDDILFVTSEQTGFGHFRNFGETRRQGIDAAASLRAGHATLSIGYTLLDATFQSAEHVNGSGNSTNDLALEGAPGLEGLIDISAGDRIPLVPRHLLKVFGDYDLSPKLSVGVNVVAQSGAFARGNENNRHQSDGRYYLGAGRSPAYAVTTLNGRYVVRPRVEFFAEVSNLLNARYYTAAQLGATGITPDGTFIARPLPAVAGGEFPVVQSTFLAPGPPRQAMVGTRVRF
jgi:outer membrane receptor protein involved in Fe transport